MAQVVQAKCPHCHKVLRIPAEWLSRSMRCKFCQQSFQAKADAPGHITANSSVPVAKPIASLHQATAVATLPRATAGDPFGFPEQEAAGTPSIQMPRKKGRGAFWLALTFLVLFMLGAGGAGYVVYSMGVLSFLHPKNDPVAKNSEPTEPKFTPTKPLRRPDPVERKDNPGVSKKEDPPLVVDPPKKDPPKKNKDKKGFPKKDGTGKPPPFSSDPFPRRALLISVDNYLMFNPVHYGSGADSFKGGYPGSSTGVLRDRLTRPPMNFPATQVVELSDGVPAESRVAKAHSTQKSVLEATIHDFCVSSRDQDHVFLLFAGHATLVDDKAYLIPIDGNVKEPESLVPLKWVYDELARCKAQQKILVLDTFRFSPSRGFELPSAGEGDEGTMPEGFDKELQNPPPGVQVWCSCQKEQSTVELDGGSAFLQALCHSLQGSPEMNGISGPTQPIPIEALVVKVNQRLKDLLTPEKRTEISRLTGKPMEGGGKFDPKEPLPPALVLKEPSVPGGEAAGAAQVDNILAEIKLLPQVRDSRAGDINLLQARNLPAFSSKKLDAYKPDGYQNILDLSNRYKKDVEGFSKEFPVRAAYFKALDALEQSRKIQSREVLSSPINPKAKAAFLLEQAPLGESIFYLEQTLAMMKEAAEEREKETSKRWQANFDYTLARLQSRLIFLFEYNYTLGQIRADNLPPLADGQSGWRIGTGKKIAVTESKAKTLSKDTAKLWKRINDQYPGTPWSLLAQRESMIALGLQWRPKSD